MSLLHSLIGTVSEDVVYNARRNLLGAIPLTKKVTCHLWNIEYSGQKKHHNVKLLKKVMYPHEDSCDICRKNSENGSCFILLTPHLTLILLSDFKSEIAYFDINPTGESVAATSNSGGCLISDLSTSSHSYHLQIGSDEGNNVLPNINSLKV